MILELLLIKLLHLLLSLFQVPTLYVYLIPNWLLVLEIKWIHHNDMWMGGPILVFSLRTKERWNTLRLRERECKHANLCISWWYIAVSCANLSPKATRVICKVELSRAYWDSCLIEAYSKYTTMKSSYLLWPLMDLKFCSFSLLKKIKIGCAIKCRKVEICKQ